MDTRHVLELELVLVTQEGQTQLRRHAPNRNMSRFVVCRCPESDTAVLMEPCSLPKKRCDAAVVGPRKRMPANRISRISQPCSACTGRKEGGDRAGPARPSLGVDPSEFGCLLSRSVSFCLKLSALSVLSTPCLPPLPASHARPAVLHLLTPVGLSVLLTVLLVLFLLLSSS